MKDEDTMKEFFSKNITVSDDNYNKPVLDYGQGFAIGTFGNFELYSRSLKVNGQHRLVYMGKNMDMDTLIMADNTTEFTIGDVPKILIKFTNLASQMEVKAIWQNGEDETILESYYSIPSPYTKRYDWWNIFLVTFKGPENLDEGNYKVLLLSEDKINDIKLTATIEFTVSYPTEEQDSSVIDPQQN